VVVRIDSSFLFYLFGCLGKLSLLKALTLHLPEETQSRMAHGVMEC
jgi:hypothetical protein